MAGPLKCVPRQDLEDDERLSISPVPRITCNACGFPFDTSLLTLAWAKARKSANDVANLGKPRARGTETPRP